MSKDFHAHHDGDAINQHHNAHKVSVRLWWAAGLTCVFMVVEALAAWLSHSLALASDAGHMATDAVALVAAALAATIASKPASAKWSYGLQRVEVLAAFVNALILLVVTIWLGVEAVGRFFNPQPVDFRALLGIGGLGLLVNVIVYIWLKQIPDAHVHHAHEHSAHDHATHSQDLNRRAALLHVLGDLLGSVAAILAGLIIYVTDWMPIDPLLSLLTSGLLLLAVWRILKSSTHILLEAVPEHVDFVAVGQALKDIEGVASVHDLHVWQMASSQTAISAHILLHPTGDWRLILAQARHLLRHDFMIEHITLQPEFEHDGAI